MPFVDSSENPIALRITKRLGGPCGLGWIIPGWSEMGDDNFYCGQYAQRRPRVGNGIDKPIVFGSQKNFIYRPFWPSQPPSVARDAQQAKFKVALASWQSLTLEQKKYYNTIATRQSRRGFDYYMSKVLKSL